MQLQFPFFPHGTKMISSCVGVYEKDGLVQYIVNGLPVYSHGKEDLQAFRYFTSNLIHQRLCRKVEIERCFHVSADSVARSYKKYIQEGETGFFGKDNRHGSCHKIIGGRRKRIQTLLYEGQSVNSIAKKEDLSEGSIRYAIKKGYLKKKDDTSQVIASDSTLAASSPTERSRQDIDAPLGIATTRFEQRVASSLGRSSGTAAAQFSHHEGLCGAGVLFVLPALLAQGLLKTKEVYQWTEKAYYSLESIVLTLAIMALTRIKTPEQLKQCKPGEIGRIIGLDRIPEVRCVRDKIRFLSNQNKSLELNKKLIDGWMKPSDSIILCVDGHQRIYYGKQANLPVKHISRQKLCLHATTEYWVNDLKGNPILVTLGEVSEKLQQVIEEDIVPILKQTAACREKPSDKNQPRCTLVFDREAYEPSFFKRLWDNHQIAVITYRKNVKDRWPEDLFKKATVTVIGHEIDMLVCEQEVVLDGITFREVRRLGSNGHQTAVITNNKLITTEQIAGYMFSRWSEENFFRYMEMDYDFDRMVQFGTEPVTENKKVVNPPYRKLTYALKKLREKISRLEAKLYPLIDEVINKPIDKIIMLNNKQSEIREKITALKLEEAKLVEQRKGLPTHITVKEMPKDKRFNKLKTESKLLLNVIKMIAYRSETVVANLLAPYLLRADEEKRMLVKQIMQTSADLIPDKNNNTLTVQLHTLSTPRHNKAAEALAKLLNQTETCFPGTNIRLVFKTTVPSNYEE